MIQTTLRSLLKGRFDASGYQLYLVKDREVALYAGHSSNIVSRLRGHIGSRGAPGASLLGQSIAESKPHSNEWTVELYIIDECSELIAKWFPRAIIVTDEKVKYAEDAFIHEYNPLYNRNTNLGYTVDNSPFTARLRREREEEHERIELEQAQKRARLVNSVCDICCEHDRWVNADDMQPCGVMENRQGFNLLCNSCDEVIRLLKGLERNPERVSKVKQALEAKALLMQEV